MTAEGEGGRAEPGRGQGVRGWGVESAAPNRPVVDMHLVKYTNKKQRAALSNSLLNGDGCCDMAGTVGIHAKGGTLKGIAHKVDEFGGETGRRRARKILDLGNVLEYG